MPSTTLSFIHKLHSEGIPTSVLGNFRVDVFKDDLDCLHSRATCAATGGRARRASVPLRTAAVSAICAQCGTHWVYSGYSAAKSAHFDALDSLHSVLSQTRILRNTLDKNKLTPQFVASKEKKLLAAQKQLHKLTVSGQIKEEVRNFFQASLTQFEALVASCSNQNIDFSGIARRLTQDVAQTHELVDGAQWVAVGLRELFSIPANIRSSFSSLQVASGFGRAAAVMPRSALYVWLSSLAVPFDIRKHLLASPIDLTIAVPSSEDLEFWSVPLSAWCCGVAEFAAVVKDPSSYQGFKPDEIRPSKETKPAKLAESARKTQKLLGAF